MHEVERPWHCMASIISAHLKAAMTPLQEELAVPGHVKRESGCCAISAATAGDMLASSGMGLFTCTSRSCARSQANLIGTDPIKQKTMAREAAFRTPAVVDKPSPLGQERQG